MVGKVAETLPCLPCFLTWLAFSANFGSSSPKPLAMNAESKVSFACKVWASSSDPTSHFRSQHCIFGIFPEQAPNFVCIRPNKIIQTHRTSSSDSAFELLYQGPFENVLTFFKSSLMEEERLEYIFGTHVSYLWNAKKYL